MCFTVAIMRDGVLMSIEEYYNTIPIIKKKKLPPLPEFPDLFLISGFEYPSLPLIKTDSIDMCSWGLIPSFTSNIDNANEIKSKTLNARDDTIFERKSFRQNIYSHRSVLPVSGFYESRDLNNIKYPYYIEPTETPCFMLGTIYDYWRDPATGEINSTFSIITTDANPLMEIIHNLKKRMPLILSYDDCEKWLDPNLSKVQIESLMKPFDENRMKAHTISKTANNSHTNRNYKEITTPFLYPELNQQSLFWIYIYELWSFWWHSLHRVNKLS